MQIRGLCLKSSLNNTSAINSFCLNWCFFFRTNFVCMEIPFPVKMWLEKEKYDDTK